MMFVIERPNLFEGVQVCLAKRPRRQDKEKKFKQKTRKMGFFKP